LEALHYNLPILIPLTQGIKQYLRGPDVHYYPVGDLNGLMDLLSSVFDHRKTTFSDAISCQNRKYFNRFVEKHEVLYNSIIHKSSSAPVHTI